MCGMDPEHAAMSDSLQGTNWKSLTWQFSILSFREQQSSARFEHSNCCRLLTWAWDACDAFKPFADRFEALQIAAGDQFCNQKVLQNDDLAMKECRLKKEVPTQSDDRPSICLLNLKPIMTSCDFHLTADFNQGSWGLVFNAHCCISPLALSPDLASLLLSLTK